MPAPHHSVFYRLDALPTAQLTASKHWRQMLLHSCLINTVWVFFSTLPDHVQHFDHQCISVLSVSVSVHASTSCHLVQMTPFLTIYTEMNRDQANIYIMYNYIQLFFWNTHTFSSLDAVTNTQPGLKWWRAATCGVRQFRMMVTSGGRSRSVSFRQRSSSVHSLSAS